MSNLLKSDQKILYLHDIYMKKERRLCSAYRVYCLL